MALCTITICLAYLISAVIAENRTVSFPAVDLGYARHVPTFLNTSLHNVTYATYRNIRFAQPPLGDLRFRAPVTPPPASNGIQDGVVPFNSTNCLQTWPKALSTPPGYNGSTWGHEDCLFLDVIVPEGLTPASASTGVPVLHWIYGGGFMTGGKEISGNPASLFEQLQADGKFIIVASNYRLGPLGWMSSEDEPTISPNIGLYDVWAALQWTRNYVHLFGGDPDKVTVMGQSAGSGILQRYLAADAQGKDVPFRQAILSSPGYRPHVNRSREMTEIYHLYLSFTGCANVTCLRQLPEEAIVEANKYIFLDQDTGIFGGPSIGFGPIIDGDLVTDLPEIILSEGHDSESGQGRRVQRVIAGTMENEGFGNDHTTWENFAKLFARTPSEATVNALEQLYGTYNNESAFSPEGLPTPTVFDWFYGDIIFKCHSYFSAKFWHDVESSNITMPSRRRTAAGATESYRYIQSIPPAYHGMDIQYYFFNEYVASVNPSIVPEVARAFQDHLRQFILGKDMQDWPEYGSVSLQQPSWLNITIDGLVAGAGGEEVQLSNKCEKIVELIKEDNDGW